MSNRPDGRFADAYGSWINGKWNKPEYLTCPVDYIIDQMFRMVEENQVKLFNYWNLTLNLNERDKLELISPDHFYYGFKDTFDSNDLFIAGSVESTEFDNYATDLYNFTAGMIIQDDDNNKRYKLASRYINALRSLWQAAPLGEFFKGWPPKLINGEGYTPARNGKKLVSLGIPSTGNEKLNNQIGLQPVLTLTITINPPCLH
jgi:hypothetical protein